MQQATDIRKLTEPEPALTGVWGLETYSVVALCDGSINI